MGAARRRAGLSDSDARPAAGHAALAARRGAGGDGPGRLRRRGPAAVDARPGVAVHLGRRLAVALPQRPTHAAHGPVRLIGRARRAVPRRRLAQCG